MASLSLSLPAFLRVPPWALQPAPREPRSVRRAHAHRRIPHACAATAVHACTVPHSLALWQVLSSEDTKQRTLLQELWRKIDVDNSNFLDETEVRLGVWGVPPELRC